MHNRVHPCHAKERLRTQPAHPKRPLLHPGARHQPLGAKARQQQGIDPDGKPDAQTSQRAQPCGPAPEQAAQQRRQDLRDPGKGDQANRRERCTTTGQAVIEISEKQNHRDRDPARQQNHMAHVAGNGHALPGLRRQVDRHHHMVRDHDRERHRRHDDHRRGGRKPADKGQHRKPGFPLAQRHAEHEEIRV